MIATARRAAFLGITIAVALAAAGCSSGSSHSSTPTSAVSTPATAPAPAPSPAGPVVGAQHAADAYVWGYPLVVTMRTMQTLALRIPVNRLVFQPSLSTVASRTIVAPNVDTLYGIALLDLRGEPYALTLPKISDRYYSFQFISAYTDAFAYLGTRATAAQAGTWVITPPGWHGTLPAGASRISAPTPQVVMLGRFLVSTPADVDRIHAAGTQIRLRPLSALTGTAPAPAPPPIGAPRGTPQAIAASGVRFFDELDDALASNPPVDAQELATMRSFADLGIQPGRHPSTSASAAQRANLARGVALGERELARSGTSAADSGSRVVNGWQVDLDVGIYGHNALLRAVVAKNGWGANVPQEAVYAHAAAAANGQPLTGTHGYVIHFASGQLPPVNGFWSVTLYGPDHFFIANPIDRYAIGDRTPGLRYGADGSLDIYVQVREPAGHEANWLPAPAGAFYLSMRFYLPKTAVSNGSYRFPTISPAP